MNEEPRFSVMDLDEETNIPDLQKWVDEKQMVGLVDEEQAGIIAYINGFHSDTVLDKLNSTNINFIPQAVPAQWDNIEVEWVQEDLKEEVCEIIHEDDDLAPIEHHQRRFWSVYAHDVKGGVQCIANVETKEQALALEDLIRNLIKNYKDNGHIDEQHQSIWKGID